MNKAYSLIEVKEYQEEGRVIKGIATTPSPDRVGDIVEPLGVKVAEDIPLFLYHDSQKVVGRAKFGKPTKKGIPFEASLPEIKEEGALKDRVDEAWQSVKYRLISAVSIGFRAIEGQVELMKTGGLRFLESEVLELSLVPVPANPDAVIQSFKGMDSNQIRSALGVEQSTDTERDELIKSLTTKQAASGTKRGGSVRLDNPAGATAKKSKPMPQEGKTMNIKEQIDGFIETRKTKVTAMEAIMEKASEEGRTLDATETEEYDTLADEVKAIDEHVTRLKAMEQMNLAKAEPVPDQSGMQKREPATLKVTEKLDKGIEFARYVMCLGAAKGDLATASHIAQKRFPHSERINMTLKAAVEAGTTTDADWALPLVEYNQFAGDFVEFLRPQTIIGKFGQAGIPSMRRVPFNIHIRGQTSGGSGYWVGQGAPKPLTKFEFEDIYLGFSKVANIAVLTQELMRFSNPSAEALVRDSLAGALIERLDIDFIDPDKAAVNNVSPASITNAATPIVASGTGDACDIRADVKSAMSQFLAANITPSAGVWIMSATTALSLSLMRNALGQKEFPDISMMGGTFEGLPVVVSEHVPYDSAGHYVVLANASDIWLADDGNVVIDASREASLQMLDDPTNNSATGTATTMVSMFQTNSVAIRAERWINWKLRRAAAVAVISGVNWGADCA